MSNNKLNTYRVVITKTHTQIAYTYVNAKSHDDAVREVQKSLDKNSELEEQTLTWGEEEITLKSACAQSACEFCHDVYYEDIHSPCCTKQREKQKLRLQKLQNNI